MAKTQKKSDKKRRLLLLMLLLVLSLCITSMATYAWFTSNKTVSMDSLDVEVRSVNGLQISADATNWKAKISVDDLIGANIGSYYPSAKNQLPAIMGHMSSDGTTTGGLLNMYYGDVQITSDGSGFEFTATREGEEKCVAASRTTETVVDCGDNSHFIAFDIFFKVNTDANIVLGSTSNVTKLGVDDKGIQNTARVAFVNYGSVDLSAEPSAAQALTTPEEVILWEPNAGSHTTYGIANAANYGIDNLATNMTTATTYYAISKNITTPVPLYDLVSGNGNVVQMSPDIVTFSSSAGTNTSGDQDFISLSAGVTKVRVYWWVEGQDVDTENNATGTSMKLDLEFSLKDNA